MPKENPYSHPDSPESPPPLIPIVNPVAAQSALKNIAQEWQQREFQRTSLSNMSTSVSILRSTVSLTEGYQFVGHHKDNMDRAERKANEYVILAESDIAQAIGVKATVQLDPERGSIQQRLVADKPGEQPVLDRAIRTAWETYGGARNTPKRAAALNGLEAVDFSGSTVESRQSHLRGGLDPDRQLHLDANQVKELSPAAQTGVNAFLNSLLVATAINRKRAASGNGLVQILPKKHIPDTMLTVHERLLRDYTEEQLEIMEEELLLEAAKRAAILRKAGLLPPAITANSPERFLDQVRLQLSLPGIDERKKVADKLQKVLDSAGVTLAPPKPPRLRSPKLSKGRKVSQHQQTLPINNS